MSLRLEEIVVDCHDPASLARDDQQAEVDRLVGLGASRVDIGQGDTSWVVMADPEGNEFCILAAR